MVSATEAKDEYLLLRQKHIPDQAKGVTAHVYCLGNIEENTNHDGLYLCESFNSQTLLDSLLISQWEACAWKGLLEYDITSCETKFITGGTTYFTQLNDKWDPFLFKEFEKKFFNPSASLTLNSMSCNKEILLYVLRGEKDKPEFSPSAIPLEDGILVIANANPIEYGHVFLIPFTGQKFTTIWDMGTFETVTKMVNEVRSPCFRAFYDYDTSSSSNHMYFQACYFPNPLPVEQFPTLQIFSKKSTTRFSICEVVGYPLNALAFESMDLNDLVGIVVEVCLNLRYQGRAFCILIANCGTKIILFPQVQGSVPGRCLFSWECGGYFIYNSMDKYDRASMCEITSLLASASLDSDSFADLKHLSCTVAAAKLDLNDNGANQVAN